MRRLNGAQFWVLGLLLSALALEFVFSPYWRDFIQKGLFQGEGTDRKIRITQEGFMVLAFLAFSTILILLLAGLNARAGIAVAALLFLGVFLARAQPIVDWLDATTQALKEASGA